MGKFGRNIKRLIAVLVGLTVVTHLVIIYNEKTKETKETKEKKLVQHHEEALCNFRLHRNEAELYVKRQECPKNGIVTVFHAGGLFSHIWAYSSVWAVAKATNLTPFIPLCTYNVLSQVFSDLTIPPLRSIAECDIPLPAAAEAYESWLGPNHSIVLPIFSCLSELALPRLRNLVREFRIRDNLLKQGDWILQDFVRNKFESPVYVGVHLPKNWVSFGDGLLYPGTKFFHAVFQQIRKRKGNAVFVIVSKDESNQFPGDDILFVNTGSVGLDLALLSLCNMSVLGYDGIGIWGAILSRKEAIVFDDTDGKFLEYLRLIPNWRAFV